MLRQFQNWNGISTLQYIQARTDEQERVLHERELKITKDDLKHKHLNKDTHIKYIFPALSFFRAMHHALALMVIWQKASGNNLYISMMNHSNICLIALTIDYSFRKPALDSQTGHTVFCLPEKMG